MSTLHVCVSVCVCAVRAEQSGALQCCRTAWPSSGNFPRGLRAGKGQQEGVGGMETRREGWMDPRWLGERQKAKRQQASVSEYNEEWCSSGSKRGTRVRSIKWAHRRPLAHTRNSWRLTAAAPIVNTLTVLFSFQMPYLVNGRFWAESLFF